MKVNITSQMKSASARLSSRFNSLSYMVRKSILLVVGLTAALVCGMITLGQLLPGNNAWIQPDPLTRPKDIHPDTIKTKMQTPAAPYNK